MPRVRIQGVGVVNFPDTMSMEEISAAADSMAQSAPVLPRTTAAGFPLPEAARRLTGSLPEILAAPGGFVPGFPGVVMSGFGGAAGEAARRGVLGEPLDPRAIAEAGLEQAGLTATGQVTGFGIAHAGRFLRGRAQKMFTKAGERAAERAKAFGTQLMDKMGPQVEEALQITRRTRKETGEKLGTMIREAAPKLPKITAQDLADEVVEARAKQLGRALSEEQESNLRQTVDRIVRQSHLDFSLGERKGKQILLDLGEVHLLKRRLAESARPEFAAAARGVFRSPSNVREVSDAAQGILKRNVKGAEEAFEAAQEAIRANQEMEVFAAQQLGRPLVRGLRQTGREEAARIAGGMPDVQGMEFGMGMGGPFVVPRRMAPAMAMTGRFLERSAPVLERGIPAGARSLSLLNQLYGGPKE